MVPKKKFDVFLSHNSKDKPWVIKLKESLEVRGIKVWLDKDEIRPGDLFAKALEEGIRESKAIALIVSPEAMESGWVQAEYYRALSLATHNQLQLIPVLYEKAEIPGFLQDRNWVDFSNEDIYLENIKKLIWGITGQKPSLNSAEAERNVILVNDEISVSTEAVNLPQNRTEDAGTDSAARGLLNKYYEEFNAKIAYLSEFEVKVNQSVSNLKILIRAHEELTSLARISRAFTEELENLGIIMDYPKNDLERNSELATSIANQAQTAAGLVAVNGNPTVQIHQIERNLPILRNMMRQLLAWFQLSLSSPPSN